MNFGRKVFCHEAKCKKPIPFNGRNHCRNCGNLFCVDHIHVDKSVDRDSEVYKLCNNCYSVDTSTSTSAPNVNGGPIDKNCTSAWEKGKQLYKNM